MSFCVYFQNAKYKFLLCSLAFAEPVSKTYPNMTMFDKFQNLQEHCRVKLEHLQPQHQETISCNKTPTCMCLHMTVQGRFHCEALPAFITLVRPLSCMDPNVPDIEADGHRAQRQMWDSWLEQRERVNNGNATFGLASVYLLLPMSTLPSHAFSSCCCYASFPRTCTLTLNTSI